MAKRAAAPNGQCHCRGGGAVTVRKTTDHAGPTLDEGQCFQSQSIFKTSVKHNKSEYKSKDIKYKSKLHNINILCHLPCNGVSTDSILELISRKTTKQRAWATRPQTRDWFTGKWTWPQHGEVLDEGLSFSCYSWEGKPHFENPFLSG